MSPADAARADSWLVEIADALLPDTKWRDEATERRYLNQGGLTVNVRKHVWFSHSAGKGGHAIELVQSVKQCSRERATQWGGSCWNARLTLCLLSHRRLQVPRKCSPTLIGEGTEDALSAGLPHPADTLHSVLSFTWERHSTAHIRLAVMVCKSVWAMSNSRYAREVTASNDIDP